MRSKQIATGFNNLKIESNGGGQLSVTCTNLRPRLADIVNVRWDCDAKLFLHLFYRKA